jgi:hypothetical protein
MERVGNSLWLDAFYLDIIERLNNLLKISIKLSSELVGYLQTRQLNATARINNHTDYIKNINPELAKIKTPRTIDKIHLIRGAIYGYPAENIDFWIKNYPNDIELNAALDIKRKIKAEFGIDHCLMRLTVSQANELYNLLKSAKPNKMTRATESVKSMDAAKYAPDSLGRVDNTGFYQFLEQRGCNND